MSTEEHRRVTLTKAQCETAAGRDLIALLTELSADGNVSREEMDRLRAWLEVDRGVDFAALPFLYEVIDHISSDGEVSEDELDRLALAIERVLPKEIRAAAALQRKKRREEQRIAVREARREAQITARTEARATRERARFQAGILHESNFPVRGAFRSSERREACERLMEGDAVTLEREPDNPHDANAILVLGEADCELGYVPREEAPEIARLLDAGAAAEAMVGRLWETPEHKVVPIIEVKIRRGEISLPDPIVNIAAGAGTATSPDTKAASTNSVVPVHRSVKREHLAVETRPGRGCATVVGFVAVIALALIGIALR